MEDLTPASIEKHVLSETLQHPLTTFPAALALLSGLYMLLFTPNRAAFLLAFGGALVSLSAWIFNYFFRGERLAENYMRTRMQARRAQRERKIEDVRSEFRRLQSRAAVQAAEELRDAYQKVKNFLETRSSQGQMAGGMRLQMLAEEAYFQGVEVLVTAAEIMRALQEINVEKLEQEVKTWEAERQALQNSAEDKSRQLSALERRLESNRKRIKSYRQRESALAELFAEAEACEASLEEAYMQFAGAGSTLHGAATKQNMDDSISRLERAVAAARRVENRIRNQQAEEAVYLAAGEVKS